MNGLGRFMVLTEWRLDDDRWVNINAMVTLLFTDGYMRERAGDREKMAKNGANSKSTNSKFRESAATFDRRKK